STSWEGASCDAASGGAGSGGASCARAGAASDSARAEAARNRTGREETKRMAGPFTLSPAPARSCGGKAPQRLSLPVPGRVAEPKAKPGGGGLAIQTPRPGSPGPPHPAAARPPSPGRGGRSRARVLHVRVVRAAAALRRGPDDVLRRVLDVAGFAVDAVLGVDDEARIGAVRLVGIDDFVHARRAIQPCGL